MNWVSRIAIAGVLLCTGYCEAQNRFESGTLVQSPSDLVWQQDSIRADLRDPADIRDLTDQDQSYRQVMPSDLGQPMNGQPMDDGQLLYDGQSDVEEFPMWEELPMPADHMSPAHMSPAQCNCGNGHCHGVCRDPGHPEKPKHDQPGDIDRGDCPPLRYRMNDCRRSGNPHAVHRWAACSVTDKYSAWFVGGGAAFCRGRCRTSDEGTWGLDYSGLFGHANVWLKYTRGRNQGGEGAYRTDGEPRVVSRAHEVLHLGH